MESISLPYPCDVATFTCSHAACTAKHANVTDEAIQLWCIGLVARGGSGSNESSKPSEVPRFRGGRMRRTI